MWLLITGVFVAGQSKEDISDCMGLKDAPRQPNFGQNRPKITEIAITSVVCGSHAEFGFEIGFVLSRNSSLTLPYTRDK